MSATFESIEPVLAPRLKQYQWQFDSVFCEYWQIPDQSIAVLVESTTHKAAVWIGKTVTDYEESPVIAVYLPIEEQLLRDKKQWYFGIENFGWCSGEFGKFSNADELGSFAIESALYGAFCYDDMMLQLKKFMLPYGDYKARYAL